MAGALTGQGLQAIGLGASLPAGDGAGAGVQDGGDGVPGVAVVQEQEDVGAVGDRGSRGLAIQMQEGLAFLRGEGDSRRHGLVSEVMWEMFHHSP